MFCSDFATYLTFKNGMVVLLHKRVLYPAKLSNNLLRAIFAFVFSLKNIINSLVNDRIE